jgi:hypothetical protein
MSFTAIATVTGNRVGTVAAAVLCSATTVVRLLQLESTCLTIPARCAGQATWTPTDIRVDRVLANLIRCVTVSLTLTPLLGVPAVNQVIPAQCGTLVPYANLGVEDDTVTLAWWVEGTVSVPSLGLNDLPVRSAPLTITCQASDAALGRWHTHVDVACLGCALVPTSPPSPSPAISRGRFVAVSTVTGNLVTTAAWGVSPAGGMEATELRRAVSEPAS